MKPLFFGTLKTFNFDGKIPTTCKHAILYSSGKWQTPNLFMLLIIIIISIFLISIPGRAAAWDNGRNCPEHPWHRHGPFLPGGLTNPADLNFVCDYCVCEWVKGSKFLPRCPASPIGPAGPFSPSLPAVPAFPGEPGGPGRPGNPGGPKFAMHDDTVK
jgi:hypothetical protein